MLDSKDSSSKQRSAETTAVCTAQPITPEPLHQQVARLIFELRTRAGLTQQELAAKIGTTQPAIARLEAKNYRGHSLTMLQRIVTAVDGNVEIRLSQESGGQSN